MNRDEILIKSEDKCNLLMKINDNKGICISFDTAKKHKDDKTVYQFYLNGKLVAYGDESEYKLSELFKIENGKKVYTNKDFGLINRNLLNKSRGLRKETMPIDEATGMSFEEVDQALQLCRNKWILSNL